METENAENKRKLGKMQRGKMESKEYASVQSQSLGETLLLKKCEQHGIPLLNGKYWDNKKNGIDIQKLIVNYPVEQFSPEFSFFRRNSI